MPYDTLQDVNIDEEIDYLTRRIYDLALLELEACLVCDWSAADDYSRELGHCRELLAYYKSLEWRCAG